MASLPPILKRTQITINNQNPLQRRKILRYMMLLTTLLCIMILQMMLYTNFKRRLKKDISIFLNKKIQFLRLIVMMMTLLRIHKRKDGRMKNVPRQSPYGALLEYKLKADISNFNGSV